MTRFDVAKKLLAAGAGAALVFTASPSQAANIGGWNSGWTAIGNVSNISGGFSLNSFGASDTQIESFLGLSSGALDALNFINATNGSAIKSTLTVNPGDVLSFNWRFQAGDYLPYNDFSFYSIAPLVNELADVRLVGNYGQTSSQTSYTFNTGGTYTVGFGVVNALDTVLNSNLTVTNIRASVSNTNIGQPVPEPMTILGTLTAAGFGVALRRKQKQQQKATAKA